MTKCKTCQHAIKLHKHPLNRMYNGAISEQVDFIGCIALGKDNGLIVDRVVEECEGWIGKPKWIINDFTISVDELKDRITYDGIFNCIGILCDSCVFIAGFFDCNSTDYDFAAIKAHDFGTITEVTIKDLEQFKIK